MSGFREVQGAVSLALEINTLIKGTFKDSFYGLRVVMVRGSLRVSLSASLVSRAVAALSLTQLSHPAVTESSCLDRQASSHHQGPRF